MPENAILLNILRIILNLLEMEPKKITFKELQELRSALWNGTLTNEQRYRLVDVIHLVMDKIPYSELQ